MKSILEELYLGNINPNESEYLIKNTEYRKRQKNLCEKEEALLKTLNESGKELLNQLTQEQLNINYITAVENFSCGFKIGALMITEALGGEAVM